MTCKVQSFKDPFAYVPQRGTAGRTIAAIARKIRCDERIQKLSPQRPRILADLKGRVKRNGRFFLKRAYWSAQTPNAADAFSARTLAYERKQEPTWYDFPSDPGLPNIREVLRNHSDSHVLRYVPFRRLTVRCQAGQTQVVVKMKRLARLEEAAKRLAVAQTSIKGSQVSFDTPRLLDVDLAAGVMTQSYCPGESILRSFGCSALPEMFGKAGKVHAELHGVQAFGLPASLDFSGAELSATISWLSAFRPDLRDRMEQCGDVLRTTAPESEDSVFCHGDFACSQLLATGDRWSLVDFDLSHRGDRYRDLAIFLASLRRELTHLQFDASDFAAAESAYIAGYEDTAGRRLSAYCLNWHRAIAEFDYLKFILRKDRYEPDIYDASIARLEALCSALRS